MPYVGPLVSASIDLEEQEPLVLFRFYNASSRPVTFWVTGVLPKKVGFEIDGNTNWSTPLSRDPVARIVEVRQDDLLGPTLVYVEVDPGDS